MITLFKNLVRLTRFVRGIGWLAVTLAASNPASAEIVTSHLDSDADMLAALDNVAVVAEGRIGDLGGAATFELDLGDDTGNPAATEQFGWQSGVAEPFALTYEAGTHTVAFTLGGKTLTYSPGLSFQEIFARTRAVDDGTRVDVYDLIINGEPVEGGSSAVGAGGLDILAISGADIANGFTISGVAVLIWSGAPPSQSRLAFQIKIGNAPTVPADESTWGKTKSLYR